MASTQVSSLLSRMSGVYRDPSRVSRDTIQCLVATEGRHLRPGSSSLVQNDGTLLPSVLNLTGTIAMVYAGTTYHIPIEMYIPPHYPTQAPIVYVRPIATMVIKDRHPHVSMDGYVHIPYLTSWNTQHGTLVECCSSMSLLFGINPPLFSRPIVTATPVTTASTTTTVSATVEPMGHVLLGQVLDQSIEADIAREVEEANAAVQAARVAEQEEEKLRFEIQVYQTRLTSRIQWILKDYMHRIKGSMIQEVQIQQELDQSYNYIQEHQLEYLTTRKNTLQQYNNEITDSIQTMQQYIGVLEEEAQREKEWEEKNGINVDTLAIPADTTSKQLLYLTAKDHALSDTFYYLDKSLEAGAMTLEKHVKMIRQLARRQFHIRAQLLQITMQGKTS